MWISLVCFVHKGPLYFGPLFYPEFIRNRYKPYRYLYTSAKTLNRFRVYQLSTEKHTVYYYYYSYI